MKNYENSSIIVKVTSKKISGTFLRGHGVYIYIYILLLSTNTEDTEALRSHDQEQQGNNITTKPR